MISAHIKFGVKQGINEPVAGSYNVLEEVPSKLELQCKTVLYFSFNFG